MFFIDSQNGWAVGFSGLIIRTNDGGTTWYSQKSNTTKSLNSIFFNNKTGWIVGDFGTILKTTTSGSTWVAEEKLSEVKIAGGFLLQQNYPNPFNASTKIKFNLVQSEIVQLRIFTINGQLVETLVNGKRTAGVHEIDWIVNDLPSSIYFCQLKVGDIVQTIKLVLQK